MRSKLIKGSLVDRIPGLVLILCAIQPLLDVISYLFSRIGISNIPTLLIRFGVLIVVLLSAFIISNNKKIYILCAVILIVHSTGHAIACSISGYADPIADLINLIRIYQLPVLTLAFITYMKANNKVYDSIKLGFIICLGIIVIVEIISVITKTNPYTYENKSIGIIGWFYDSSAQSAILSALVPLYISAVITRFRNNFGLMLLGTFGGCMVLFLYATRLAYVALIVSISGLLITLLIKDIKAGKAMISLALLMVLFIAAIPFSPMEKNQSMVADNAIKKQHTITTLITEYEAKAEKLNLSDEEFKLYRLEGAYREYMGAMIDRFGMDKVADAYGYSEKASDICDVRRIKNTYCTMLIKEQGLPSLLFGCEIDDMYHNDQVFDAENDLHGIFYLCGGVGLFMMICFLGYFVIIIIKTLIFNFSKSFNIETAGLGIALIMLFLHIYATSGVLRRPSASIYLSLVAASVYIYIQSTKKGIPNDK